MRRYNHDCAGRVRRPSHGQDHEQLPPAEEQRAVLDVAKDLPALIRPEEPPPQVDRDAYAASGGGADLPITHITVSGSASSVDCSASTLPVQPEQHSREAVLSGEGAVPTGHAAATPDRAAAAPRAGRTDVAREGHLREQRQQLGRRPRCARHARREPEAVSIASSAVQAHAAWSSCEPRG